MRALPREVWWVDGDRLSLVPASEQRKLFNGDCYILQYTYLGNERDENLFYAWLGGGSVMEDRTDTISHMNAIVESSRGILLWEAGVNDTRSLWQKRVLQMKLMMTARQLFFGFKGRVLITCRPSKLIQFQAL